MGRPPVKTRGELGKIDPHRLYTVGEAANLIGVSAPTIRRYCNRDQLESHRTPSGLRRISGTSIRRLINNPPPRQTGNMHKLAANFDPTRIQDFIHHAPDADEAQGEYGA